MITDWNRNQVLMCFAISAHLHGKSVSCLLRTVQVLDAVESAWTEQHHYTESLKTSQ